ncbi:hypothetical protein AB8P51_15170, partial [Muriicola sp. SD30]|uniref:hypothetical protein n=1 Tax=Muriicola sp. SD30 TaxID=3240936 RepID=UPI00350ED7D0
FLPRAKNPTLGSLLSQNRIIAKTVSCKFKRQKKMGRHKMTSGICRLCGQNTELSFEHVPPRVALNKKTKYKEVDFDEYLKSKNPLNDPPKGKIRQGGVGYNSFCKKCNSFLGSNYVPAYSRWVQAGLEILKNKEVELHSYLIKEIEPQKIFKQIISMFLAINKEWYLESYPDLAEYVSDKNSRNLPDRYKIFCYLTRAERIRYMHHVVHGNISKGAAINCSEIAFPPYGYVLTIDNDNKIEHLTEITEFKNHKGKIDLNFNMFQLPTYMPLPLDYRTKEQLEMDIARGNEVMKSQEKNNKTSS